MTADENDVEARLRQQSWCGPLHTEAADEIKQLRRIRSLLIMALAHAIGREDDDEALLEDPLTQAKKFRKSLIADKPTALQRVPSEDELMDTIYRAYEEGNKSGKHHWAYRAAKAVIALIADKRGET